MKTTPETMNPQLALLKKHFANCFDKHGNFIPAKLQEIVQASGVALSKEGYSLNWLGKSYARLLANENIRTLLKADTAHNAQPANATSQNLLIKGDNLEVLKHLMGAYSEQVKMIYIDPPYNTGSDGFVYQDNRKFTVDQLSSLAGIDEDEAKRILEFTSSSSNSHSAWLTFMYPRLYLARQLLRDDGVIFISIDDNEQAQLKVLCDEVFGEENFVDIFSWKKTETPANLSNKTKKAIEYIICYQKTLLTSAFRGLKKESKSSNGLMNQTNSAHQLIFPENVIHTGIEDGLITAGTYGTDSYEIKLLEDVVVKNGYFTTSVKLFGKFKWAQPNLDREISDGTKISIRTKALSPSYEREEYDAEKPWNIIDRSFGVGTNENASSELDALIGINVFNFPKPTSLLEYVIQFISTSQDIILDFFAGSGTTAHAVMQLNAEDGGNRQFICVQIDEATDPNSEAHKAGYKTIFDITQARITKAAAKIQSEHPDCKADMGFKVFETAPMFDKYLDAPEELTETLELFDVKKLSQADRHNLMLTWALRDGIKLGVPLVPVTLGDYTVYAAGKTLYFVEPDISLDAVVVLLEQLDNNPDFSPSRLVVLGYLLDSKAQREMTEAVKHYNNRKGIELTLDIRYN